jgi:SHS2 domain-containing protein
VWAAAPERLYALAAVGVLAQVAEVADIADVGEVGAAATDDADHAVELALDGSDPEDLLVHWVNTALLEAEIRRALWTRARVLRLEPMRAPTSLTGRLEGPRLDPARHTLLREVKAVSHHHLGLSLAPGRCRCRLVLDL